MLNSLKPLWDTDISGYALAAVEDMNSSFTDKHRRLGLPESYLYFNAGVLLINLDYWRSHDVMNRLMIWMGQYRTRIVAHDQDLLNAVLSKEVTYLSHRWNMQEGMLRRRRHTLPSSESTIDQEMKQPAIIHFAGKHKPWQEKCINPYKPMWERYTDMSPWKGMRPQKHIGFTINRLTFPLQDALRTAKRIPHHQTKMKVMHNSSTSDRYTKNIPIVSIIVPNYNYARFLDIRMESILNQTFQDFEIILLDDHSTDNSVEIIEKYRNNPKVSYIDINKEKLRISFPAVEKGYRVCPRQIYMDCRSRRLSAA